MNCPVVNDTSIPEICVRVSNNNKKDWSRQGKSGGAWPADVVRDFWRGLSVWVPSVNYLEYR